MTTDDLINSLGTRGVVLSVDGDELVVDAPPGVLTDEDLATLRRRKAQLISLLADALPTPARPEWPDGWEKAYHKRVDQLVRRGWDWDRAARRVFLELDGLAVALSHAERILVASHTPWRAEVAGWPIPLRERWGLRANELEDSGLGWREAEERAFDEVSASTE